MPAFAITLEQLEDAEKTFSFVISDEWLTESLRDTQLRAAGDHSGTLEAKAQYSNDDVFVKAAIHADMIAACSRCLEDVPVHVNVTTSALLQPLSSRTDIEAKDVALSPEDLERDYYSGVTIVLDAMVREQLILEVPMQPLCKEDCGGLEIPEHLRAPALEDPRLEPLRQLKRQMALSTAATTKPSSTPPSA